MTSEQKTELRKLIAAKKRFIEAVKEFEKNTGCETCEASGKQDIHLFEASEFIDEDAKYEKRKSDYKNYMKSMRVDGMTVFTLLDELPKVEA
jgi:type II secretory ATPase GspE/PulE/Tfp pilus assembly ATPase PilB-like protein